MTLRRHFLGLMALGMLAACGGTAPSTPSNSASLARNIGARDAASLQASGAFVLDVREQYEWNEGHIQNATLIPLGSLASRTGEVPKDRPVVVVCQSGNRSQTGRDALLAAGFTQVTSMDGGMLAWQRAGLPIAR